MTFNIEDLSPPGYLLPEKEYTEIIASYSKNIEASSCEKRQIVHLGKQAFIRGLHQAYAEHRPFTISPDILWLLICQGFSKHVNSNSDELRTMFVEHKAKKELRIRNDELLAYPEKWIETIPSLVKQVEANIKGSIIETLTADFSTTTITSDIACKVTMLDTFKSFFDYTVVTGICGIPAITLLGTIEDWEKIILKLNKLSNYNLVWWTSELLPIIDKIIATLNGDIDKIFWRNIYKVHTPNEYGATEKITGWIAKFFPYDKFGEKTKLSLLDIDDLPDELCAVDFTWEIIGGPILISHKMTFTAGFVGLSQNKDTFSLKPEIGWWVSESNSEKKVLPKIDSDGILNYYLIKEVPKELYKIRRLNSLSLSFVNDVKIPLKLGKISLSCINVSGQISNFEIFKLKNLFPNALVYVNGEMIQHQGNLLARLISTSRYFLRF